MPCGKIAEEEDYLTRSAVAYGSPTCCTLVYMSYTFLHPCTLLSGNIAEEEAVHCSGLMVHPHTPCTPFYTFGHPPSGKIAEEKDYLTNSALWGLQHARGHHIKIGRRCIV